jgi:hypothetical protein
MKNIVMTTIVATFMLTVVSCNSWLSLAPISNISSSSFWTEAGPGEYSAYLSGIYSQLRTDNANIFYLGELRSDNVGGVPFGGEATQGMENFWNSTLNSINPGVSNFGGFYTNINSINILIKHCLDTTTNSTQITSSFRNTMLGKAYGMRAFYYFQLMKSWGNVVLSTTAIEGAPTGNTALAASPVTDVMTQIKSDIGSSVKYFGTVTTATYADWSLWATLALEGEVYLWSAEEMNGGAADAAIADAALTQITNSGLFKLITTTPSNLAFSNFNTACPYRGVFDSNNKGNAEIIFAIKYSTTETSMAFILNNFIPQSTYLGSFYPDTINGVKFNKAVENYSGLVRVPINNNILNRFNLSDTRRNVSIKDVYSYPYKGPLAGVYLYKYQGINYNGARVFADDYIVYRYADVLLLLDEAKAIEGTNTWSGLDAVRARAFNNTSGTYNYPSSILDTGIYASSANWQEILLRERQWEFIGEGQRWYDLRRMGNKYVEKYTNATQDYQMLMPIDQNSLILNPALVQNPGYN